MPEKVDFDVVVIGLGPTGGTLANLLAMHGLSVCVLEREAALMQRVAHERVCKLYEYHFSSDRQLCAMVMELLEE
ncbi:MAG: FAD-dependent monooxygenase, partial [Candidatus Puniceispirillaceae bacterium]